MKIMTEIFSPPTVEWFKKTAKKLRSHIGNEVLTLGASYNLLAKVYGYAHFAELRAFSQLEHVLPTLWDYELDETTLAERVYLQVQVLRQELGVSQEGALQLREALMLSGYPTAPDITEYDEVEEFCDRLDALLQLHRPATATRPRAERANPVVTYKKRRALRSDSGIAGGDMHR